MGNSAKRDIRTADVQEKRARALDLRRRGLTYRDVAKQLGCALSIAHEYVHEAIAAIPREAAEDVRALELAKLDASERRLARAAQKAEHAGEFGVVATVTNALTKIAERRSKLLGLDAPEKIEHSGTVEATPEAARAVMASLFGQEKVPANVSVTSGDTAEAPERLPN
jgi:hypothetical protein